MFRFHCLLLVVLLSAGCDAVVGTVPAGDAGLLSDAGPADSGTADAGSGDSGAPDAGTPDSGTPDSGMPDSGEPDAGLDAGKPDAGQPDSGQPDAGSDAGFCGAAKLCEQFENYTAGALNNGATLGPWKVNVNDANGAVSIDSTHAVSGGKALKVHITNGSSSGGQLRTRTAAVFSPPTGKLYGRFMMYLAGGAGTSQHWTMFGAAGKVPAGTPASGNTATFLYSAFANSGKNAFGDVYYNSNTAQDCWHTSPQLMPLDRWACVAFSVDGPAIKYRFWLDGQPVPSMSVDTTGDGCVAHPAASPWYGPLFDEFYVGALSFHPMTASLDLWVDDLILDTNPVSCP